MSTRPSWVKDFSEVANRPEFKKDFWDWFDDLDISSKRAFWNYKLDTSELYFFNKAYNNNNNNKKGMTDYGRRINST